MKPSGAVLAVAAVLFLWYLWGHDLWAPDEPYFGEGAREMVVDGRWIVPHVNGSVTTDKPPLFFWLIALLSLPFGRVEPLTARLPSALAALGTLWLTMWLARRHWGERASAMAGIVLATTYLFWDKARSAQIDSLLCFLVFAALCVFDRFRCGEADGRRAGCLFWATAGLAVLAKGPVGLLIPLGVALTTLAIDRNMAAWRRFAPVAGPLVFTGVVGAWVVATLFSGTDYSVWGALRQHFVERAVHGMHHVQPPWYYLKVLPVQLLPWSLLVPGALYQAWRRGRPVDRFLLVQVAFVVVFFSISTEKRDLYVLPAYPAFALMAAKLVADAVGHRASADAGGPVRRGWITVPQVSTGAVFVAVGMALPLTSIGFELVPVELVIGLGSVIAGTGAAAAALALAGRTLRSVLATAVGIAGLYVLVATVLLPSLNEVKSARAFSGVIDSVTAASRGAGQEVISAGLGNLPEAFSFYTNGIYLRETDDPDDLAAHLDRPVRVYAVANAAWLDRLPEPIRGRFVVAATARLSRRDVVLIHNGAPEER